MRPHGQLHLVISAFVCIIHTKSLLVLGATVPILVTSLTTTVIILNVLASSFISLVHVIKNFLVSNAHWQLSYLVVAE